MKSIKDFSIRTKLMLGFSCIFTFMFVLLLILNNLFVDDFFIYKSKNTIKTNTDKVVKDSGELLDMDEIRRLEKLTGCVIRISDGDKIVYPHGMNQLPPDGEGPGSNLYDAAEKSEAGVYEVVGEGEFINQELIHVRVLPNGDYLIMIKTLGMIMESRQLFISFLGIASIFVYIISLVVTYIYSERFSRPIIELKEAANRITRLDFKDKIEPDSKDEIGELVESVNAMADELAFNIKALHESNFLLTKELNKEKSLELMRRRFVSDVSHELKNPIGMIMGYADGLERGLPKTEEDKAYYAHVINEQGKKMNRLVKDLLDLSSYMSGTFVMEMEDVDLASLIREVNERFKHTGINKKVNLKIDDANSYRVHIDPLRMEQVITNLIDNAYKHSEEKGYIEISLSADVDKVKMMIANTGDLIPQDELDNIWESFYQVDTDTEGNGLGLAIVKSIVELHNGQVEVMVDEKMNYFTVVLNNNL